MKEIKRFILRALARAPKPLAEENLYLAIKEGIVPRPLQSDIERAKNELESGGFILGQADDLDGTRTWSLTATGRHKAAELES